MNNDDDVDLLLDGDPLDPEVDWQECFPDRTTWDLWVADGWGGAPWTAGCWFRAGFTPEEATALSARGMPAPGTIDSLGRGLEAQEPEEA